MSTQAGGRTYGFNMDHTTEVMNMVLQERIRQVHLGRTGKIPYACEDAETNDVFRMGVLGEEYGEVCTAIIERQGLTREMEEYVHTAAVAVACAEGVMRKRGIDRAKHQGAQVEHNYVKIDAMADQHMEVLLLARTIYEERTAQRGAMWRDMGWRGQLFNMKMCMDRLWRAYWAADPDDLDETALDNALDMINFSVFAYIMLKERNRDGNWEYPDGE